MTISSGDATRRLFNEQPVVPQAPNPSTASAPVKTVAIASATISDSDLIRRLMIENKVLAERNDVLNQKAAQKDTPKAKAIINPAQQAYIQEMVKLTMLQMQMEEHGGKIIKKYSGFL